jgi:hypothetical protein
MCNANHIFMHSMGRVSNDFSPTPSLTLRHTAFYPSGKPSFVYKYSNKVRHSCISEKWLGDNAKRPARHQLHYVAESLPRRPYMLS